MKTSRFEKITLALCSAYLLGRFAVSLLFGI